MSRSIPPRKRKTRKAPLELEVLEDRSLPSAVSIAAPSGDTINNVFLNDKGQVAGTGVHLDTASYHKYGNYITSSDALLWSQTGGAQVIQAGAEAMAINNNGQVLGAKVSIQNGRAQPTSYFLWDSVTGNFSAVAAPSGETLSSSQSHLILNDQGQVAGTAFQYDTQATHKFAYIKEADSFLWSQTAGAQVIQTNAMALALNNSGQVVDQKVSVSGGAMQTTTNYFLRDNAGHLVAIAAPSGDTISSVFLNDQGQVAGTAIQGHTAYQYQYGKYGKYLGSSSFYQTRSDAFLWSQAAGVQTVLNNATVLALNNVGQLVGQSVTLSGGQSKPATSFFKDTTSGNLLVIAAPSGDTISGLVLNDKGQAAGTGIKGHMQYQYHYSTKISSSFYQTASDAFFWTQAGGTQVLQGNATALEINKSGQVLGTSLSLVQGVPQTTGSFLAATAKSSASTSLSTVSVTSATIVAGTATAVTLTARNSSGARIERRPRDRLCPCIRHGDFRRRH